MTDEELLAAYRSAVDYRLRYGASSRDHERLWFECCKRGLREQAQAIYWQEKNESIKRANGNMERIEALRRRVKNGNAGQK